MTVTTLAELLVLDEAERLAIVQAVIADAKAAWDTLPQAEKDRIIAESEKKWEESFQASCNASEDEDDG